MGNLSRTDKNVPYHTQMVLMENLISTFSPVGSQDPLHFVLESQFLFLDLLYF